ncbi:hypothetical protein [Geminocystis sp. NIES-3709]|uniref:hypothetical protein n=1 Tax=Geminocystis sp. NIES-3709 TaxID=1617448 RepID=UPI0005FC3A56|nr:hypothetical protein [Geminocystis sp. NIES-3709]BAQ67089.1 hypothetical protein GM3709_3854 [Geminocystis sp. NIES-3709]
MDKHKLKQLILAHTRAKCRTIDAYYDKKYNPSPEAEAKYQELLLEQDIDWRKLLDYIHTEEDD